MADYIHRESENVSLVVREPIRKPGQDNDGHEGQLDRRILTPVKADDPADVECRTRQTLAKPGAIDLCPSITWPTAFYREFTKKVIIGTVDAALMGCTVIIAYTKEACWVGHIWEVPGFGLKENPGKNDWKEVQFQSDVIDFLTKGLEAKSEDQGTGKDKKTIHIDASPKIAASPKMFGATVYVLTVGGDAAIHEDPALPKYGKQHKGPNGDEIGKVVDLIKTELKTVDAKIHVIPYLRPIDKNTVIVSFEYDPNPTKSSKKKTVRIMLASDQPGYPNKVIVKDEI